MDDGDGTADARRLLARGQSLHSALRAWAGHGSARLQKLVRTEISFLTRLSALPRLPAYCPALRSTNFDHLEEVFRILQHPRVSGVSAVMQNVEIGGGLEVTSSPTKRLTSTSGAAHVDVVCVLDGKPAWLIVSRRNPRFVSWEDTGKHGKGLKGRLTLLLRAALADPLRQPQSIFLCFAGEVGEDVDRGLRDEMGALHVPSLIDKQQPSALEDCGTCHSNDQRDYKVSDVEGWEWVDLQVNNNTSCWNHSWETYEIGFKYFKQGAVVTSSVGSQKEVDNVNKPLDTEQRCTGENNSGSGNSTFLSPAASDEETKHLRPVHSLSNRLHGAGDGKQFVNLDTTALVALVSEVSNGGADHLVALSPGDLEKRFPSMASFIIEQAISELDRPLAPEIELAMADSQPVVSHYVYDEFLSIVSKIGGVKENERATELLKRIRVVPDRPSTRVMALPLSGTIKRRHKIVFGTGDFLNAPTLTANLAFVRAAKEKGMSIAILEHRPRALTGD